MHSIRCSVLLRRWLGLAACAPIIVATFFSCTIKATAEPEPPALRSAECGFEPLPVSVECFVLPVPENRNATTTRTIELFVAVLKTPNPTPAPDPVLYLEGGPGEAATASVAEWAESPLLADRDIVLLDQRGTGRSVPALACPEVDAAMRDAFAATGREDRDELEAMRAAARACAERLRAAQVDLDGYTSIQTALDAGDLRRALGVAEWNVYGLSYGTRAALAVLRYAPDGVRSAVLDSGSPPDEFETRPSNLVADVTAGLDHFFDACSREPACRAAHPDLQGDFEALVERYNAVPFRADTTVETEVGPRPIALELTGDDLYAAITILLKEEAVIPMLPDLISGLAAGEEAPFTDLLVPLVTGGVLLPGATFHGAQFSVDCADQPPALDAADHALLADPGVYATMFLFASGSYCADWGVAPAPADYHQPVRSDVPTLLLAGSFDPISLPDQTRQAGAGLTRATYVELPASGHGPSRSNDCAAALVAAFVAAPTSALETGCVAAQAGPIFAT